jgi:hypothetical protein
VASNEVTTQTTTQKQNPEVAAPGFYENRQRF